MGDSPGSPAANLATCSLVSRIKRLARTATRKLGVAVVRTGRLPLDFDDELAGIVGQVRAETMTSPERIAALVQAVRYVDRYGIPGAIVECGVWRGGSSMAAALAHPSRDRDLWLYDTYEGMSEPTEHDRDPSGRAAAESLAAESKKAESAGVWAASGIDTVRANMERTGYPPERVHYVPGKVEDTIPGAMPEQIAVLRLDTDWYESTRHELEHLAPLVAPGGVLVIDDYGHWQGARKAVDEWLAARKEPVMLTRVDYTGRVAVLP